MLRRVSANSQGSPRSTLDREQGRCPYATAIVDKLVSRGLAERTACDGHPLTEGPEPFTDLHPAVTSSPLTVLDEAENFASQIRAFSGGRGFRKGDAGLAKDAEVQFPGYGGTRLPERKRCINMLVSLGRGPLRHSA